MKIFFKIVLLAFILFGSIDAQAQYKTRAERRLTADFRVGLNISDMDIEGGNEYKISKVGFQMGVLLQYKFVKGLQFQTGLILTSKGLKQDQYTYEEDLVTGTEYMTDKQTTVEFNYVLVPFYLGYEHFFTKDFALNINAGPYAAYGFKGKKSVSGSKYKLRGLGEMIENYDTGNVNTFGHNSFERWDYGLGGAVGLVYDIYSFAVGYEYSMSSLHDKGFYPTIKALKHRNTYISAGFRF